MVSMVAAEIITFRPKIVDDDVNNTRQPIRSDDHPEISEPDYEISLTSKNGSLSRKRSTLTKAVEKDYNVISTSSISVPTQTLSEEEELLVRYLQDSSLSFSMSTPSTNLSSAPSTNLSQAPSATLSLNSPSTNPPTFISSPDPTPSVLIEGTATGSPSNIPSIESSSLPSFKSSMIPSSSPSISISLTPPSASVTNTPFRLPSLQPSLLQSSEPSRLPSWQPSVLITENPSTTLSDLPSLSSSDIPSVRKSGIPSDPLSLVPSIAQSDQPSQVPSNTPIHSLSSPPSDHPSSSKPSQVPSIEISIDPTSIKQSPRPSSHPTIHLTSSRPSQAPSNEMSIDPTSIQPFPLPTSHPSSRPTRLKCFNRKGRRIITSKGKRRKCNYIVRNKKKMCDRGDKYCANESGKLFRDYSGPCCDSCNAYYNEPRCSTLTVTSPPTIACKPTTIEVKLNDEINENGLMLRKYNPSKGKFSSKVYAKGRKHFNEANKTYTFDVGCLETKACYRFTFKDKDRKTGKSDGFLSGNGYVKVVYGEETIRYSKFNKPKKNLKRIRVKFGDRCPIFD
ncbi:hypothetical protein CTEN210_11692 [Chaetoceros tenuissimus]|uniref:Circumsporozoite protein n=1 Tax=Chaetoceros tenuissimus TaxID=426638 RepID=A0AAD3H9J1_9STRA|nr:hypothetical protein CTEN210_11692 [Chaetoceros tenuissimus]